MKVCNKCKLEKDLTEFYKNKRREGGRDTICKRCIEDAKMANIDDYRAYRDKENDRLRKYYEGNTQVKKLYAQKRKESGRAKEYRYENIDRERESARRSYYNNMETRKATVKVYYEENKDEINAKIRQDRKDNPEKYTKTRKRAHEKAKIDPLYRIKVSMRGRIGSVCKKLGAVKSKNMANILGCEYDIFIKHIERQFKPIMTWENYGEWQIDHIVPLAIAKSESDVYLLCHYTNLQPLWAIENIKKGNKILPVQMKIAI